jgi:multidrug efflux pump subunit AcrB
MESLIRAYFVAMVMIYGLLAIPFKSYVQPFIVMCAIPFGLIGAVLGHYIMGIELTILSMFGVVALTGVVVNDSLVMVDFVNRNRSKYNSLLEAVSISGVARFRAIWLTSLTTFAGLTPLVFFEKSVQAQFLVPMAVSLGFGVMFATVVTLVLVPSLYMILEDIRNTWNWLYGRNTSSDSIASSGSLASMGR